FLWPGQPSPAQPRSPRVPKTPPGALIRPSPGDSPVGNPAGVAGLKPGVESSEPRAAGPQPRAPGPQPRAAAGELIPQIFFRVLHLMSLQQGDKFLLEWLVTVMLLLILNVRPHFLHLGLADTEGSIAGLPRKATKAGKGFVDPTRRFGLERA